ncbi:MAG: AtpZ/AtpI family protein [Chloroflexi bacterium]|nr:AtpZ/AtpI family protein [Chloroflexota bacterium]
MDRSTLRALGMVSGLGFGIAIPLGLAFLGGLWLDGRMGSKPLFMLLGIVLGFVIAGFTIAELLSFQREGQGRLLRGNRQRAARPQDGEDR